MASPASRLRSSIASAPQRSRRSRASSGSSAARALTAVGRGFARSAYLPARADRLDRLAGEALIGLPVAARNADAADAFAIDDDRKAALHGGPALRAGRERKPDRV